MKIREVKWTDAEGIARVHVDSWKTTYKGIIPDEFLNQLSYEKRTALWVKNIESPDNYILIAEDDNSKIVGFAVAGRRESNQVKNGGDVTAIYILDEFQGKGIGKKLIQELFVHFKENGYQKIFVEVLEDNHSRYFYEKMGAKFCETTTIMIHGKELNLSIYAWEI